MKGSPRTSGEGMEVDRRVRAFAWRRQVAKLLFRIVTTWVQYGQSKAVCVVRRHYLLSARKVGHGPE
jgi:hypothetical protein